MAQPISVLGPLTLAAASANNIALSQTPTFPAAFIINGSAATSGVATLDVARRVIVTTTDNTHTATVSGTDRNGIAFSETVTLNAGAAATTHDFLTVTGVTTNAQLTAAATIGTNTTASTAPLILDSYANPGTIGLTAKLISGAATYSIEGSNEDYSPNWDLNTNSPTWYDPTGYIAQALATFAGLTASKGGVIIQPLTMVRLTITSGTGKVQVSVQQAVGFARY